ncbi:MAG: PHP domain-containing protein [Dehalococcoidia bacterium]|nr:PHP domain-containing protein [Dehalococcoidia bacterium]
MLIDLHCHTLPLSTCSALEADQLVALARERGLDGICLTEHDRAWPEAELRALRERTGFPIFSGVELTTDQGHVLAFGLDDARAFSAIARQVHEAAKACGALLFLAHPARDGLLRVTHDTVEFFLSVEAVNGSDSRLQNMAASGLAHGFRLPGIGGSDAHTAAEVGRAATRFRSHIETQAELLEALRAGQYEAVALEH